jgi:hypothetical protein
MATVGDAYGRYNPNPTFTFTSLPGSKFGYKHIARSSVSGPRGNVRKPMISVNNIVKQRNSGPYTVTDGPSTFSYKVLRSSIQSASDTTQLPRGGNVMRVVEQQDDEPYDIQKNFGGASIMAQPQSRPVLEVQPPLQLKTVAPLNTGNASIVNTSGQNFTIHYPQSVVLPPGTPMSITPPESPMDIDPTSPNNQLVKHNANNQLVQQQQAANQLVLQQQAANQLVLQQQAANQLVQQQQAANQLVLQQQAANQLVQLPQAQNQLVQLPQAQNQLVQLPQAQNQLVQHQPPENQLVQYNTENQLVQQQPAGELVTTGDLMDTSADDAARLELAKQIAFYNDGEEVQKDNPQADREQRYPALLDTGAQNLVDEMIRKEAEKKKAAAQKMADKIAYEKRKEQKKRKKAAAQKMADKIADEKRKEEKKASKPKDEATLLADSKAEFDRFNEKKKKLKAKKSREDAESSTGASKGSKKRSTSTELMQEAATGTKDRPQGRRNSNELGPAQGTRSSKKSS